MRSNLYTNGKSYYGWKGRITAGLCAVLLTLLGGTARAQDATEPQPPKPPSFPLLFKTPTGMNGYEEWVQAGDLIQNNKLADAVMEPGATLTLKRQMLTDPQVQQALHLLHQGLQKPVQSPHLNPDENTAFSEFSAFRKLARILYVQIYVCFSEGRIDAAIDTLGDGLRFGYRMQTDSLISGLVGVAIETIVLRGFGRHLDQLSQYQCDHVLRLVEDWKESPSPGVAVMLKEKQTSLRILDAKRTDVKGLEAFVNLSADDEEGLKPDDQALANHLKTHPQEAGTIIDQAKTRIAAYYDNAIATMKLPAQERKPLPELKDKSMGSQLANMLAPVLGSVMNKYDQVDAMIRLLGVHVAIHRYRWEHNFLPNSLADLHAGHLIDDPFTGNALMYQKTGTTYDLFSQGPLETDDNGKPSGTRRTVRL